MKKLYFPITIIIILLAGCIEFYDPETDEAEQVLVVQGLITNIEKEHYVKLSLSGNLHGSQSLLPVKNAIVYVQDDIRRKFIFTEQTPGYYVSSPDFKAEIGRSYTLHIETADLESYISRPQKILPPTEIGTLYGVTKTRYMFLPANNGELILNSVEGIEVFADVKSPTGGYPMFRFDPDLLIQHYRYIYIDNPVDPDIEFCRVRKPMNDLNSVTAPEIDGITGNTIHHSITFVPFERRYFKGSFIDGFIDRRFIILRQYSLNEDSYQFYKRMNEQLQSDNTIFDPVAVQLPGNITCQTDPSKPALGFFEASAFSSETYKMESEPLWAGKEVLIRINDLNYLPGEDCYMETVPVDWVY